MKKCKFINSIIGSTTVLAMTCAAIPLYSCGPDKQISISLSYNDGQTGDITIDDKSEPLVFSTTTSGETTKNIIIKSSNDNIAILDENNQLVPQYIGSTEIYACFEDEPDNKSNSITVTIERSSDQKVINDDNVVDADIFYKAGLPSIAILSGFKADFAINDAEDKIDLEKHDVIASIRWEQEAPTFESTVEIINISTNFFGKSTFDLQITAKTDLTEDQYSFYIDFLIDDSDVISSKKMTLNKREMSYIVNDSTDSARLTDNWKKTILTNFSTDADILSGSFIFSATFESSTIEEPTTIEIVNKKFNSDLQLYTFDVEINWVRSPEIDVENYYSFVLNFWINNVSIHTTEQYIMEKVNMIYTDKFGESFNIVDDQEPYLILDLKANFVFTNQTGSHPIVQAFWSQPVFAEQITPPKSITFQNIESVDGWTNFQIKLVWAERFVDTFIGSSFVLDFTADGQPVRNDSSQYVFTWHYGVVFNGSTSTTLMYQDGSAIANVSKFSSSSVAGYDIDLISTSDFNWVGENKDELPEPNKIMPYTFPTEINFSFGLALVWDESFTITEEVHFTFDVLYENEVVFNDFAFAIRPKSPDQFWDIQLEQTNATLTVETNTEDLIEVSVSNIAPGSTLGTFYAKVDGIVANYDEEYITYANNMITIYPDKSLDFIPGSQVVIGIEYYIKSQVTTCLLNVPKRPPKELGDGTILSPSGKISVQANKPIYFEIDPTALSGYIAGDDDIRGIMLLVGDLSSSDFTQWDICPCDVSSCYCSVECHGMPLTDLTWVISLFPYIKYDMFKNMSCLFKFTPTQNFNNADVWAVFPA